ncbi:hypothetical protein [Clostridium coskatii]|uniref:Uncharacterized protein n=1 Tax=Clostridium coskatii TaxID=1705578 RepID=A0A162L8G2_9CLOT|nr:hypothetical protein [Clostridium coskatii]OAA92572.1 hypothetical protein WX73_00868 [Clostridium coskatii]OBR91501.1 hypothetical protein CLCOS_34210 [Clostridium coskatii]
MSFFSRSSEKNRYGDRHRGSNYYKREGFLNRILRIFGSLSNSGRKYNNKYSHSSHQNHYSDRRHYSNQRHHRRYKSSWS